MKRFALLLLFVTSIAAAADKQATADYKDLVERAKSGDRTVDFGRLRLAFADSKAFEKRPYTDPQKAAMWAALKGKNYDEAIKNAEVILAGNYADMDTHSGESAAYKELRNTALSDLHDFIYHGLLKSSPIPATAGVLIQRFK